MKHLHETLKEPSHPSERTPKCASFYGHTMQQDITPNEHLEGLRLGKFLKIEKRDRVKRNEVRDWRNLGAREVVRESRHSEKCLFPEEPFGGPREGAVSKSEVPPYVTDPGEMRCLSAQGSALLRNAPPPPRTTVGP